MGKHSRSYHGASASRRIAGALASRSVLFRLGHGLSYTSFAFKDMVVEGDGQDEGHFHGAGDGLVWWSGL